MMNTLNYAFCSHDSLALVLFYISLDRICNLFLNSFLTENRRLLLLVNIIFNIL